MRCVGLSGNWPSTIWRESVLPIRPVLNARGDRMRIPAALPALLLLVAAWGNALDVRADELVEVAPRRADVRPGSGSGTTPLLGFLARPTGPGRFPAVILLHGCIGFTEHEPIAAATLKAWGYVVLALDSLGGADRCGGDVSLGIAAAMR